MSELLHRRETIRRILTQSSEIDSQETLRTALARGGFEVTQATLSRDLAALGAHRITHADGGTTWELDPVAVAMHASQSQVRPLSPLVREVVSNGAIVVVLVAPGAASAVAVSIDTARIPEALGTVAGDDTILVAPRHFSQADALAVRLTQLFGIHGETSA